MTDVGGAKSSRLVSCFLVDVRSVLKYGATVQMDSVVSGSGGRIDDSSLGSLF